MLSPSLTLSDRSMKRHFILTPLLVLLSVYAHPQRVGTLQSVSGIEKLSDNKEAIAAYDVLLQQVRSEKDTGGAVMVLDHLGKRAFATGNTAAMIRYEKEALRTARLCKSCKVWQALLFNNLGICYQSAGNYDSSLLMFQYAITAQDSFGSRVASSVPYLNLGLLYYRLRRYGPAETALKKSLAIAEKDHDLKMTAAASLNLGSQYAGAIHSDSFPAAGRLLRKAVGIAEAEQYTDVLNKGYYALGLLAEKQGDTAAAISLYQKALLHPIGIAYDDLIPLVNLGHIYLSQRHYAKAEAVLHDGLLKALWQKPAPDYILDFYYYLAEVFQATGRYKEAAAFYRQYADLADSLRGPETGDRISALEARFAASEHSRQVIQRELKIQKQRTVIMRERILLAFLLTGMVLLSISSLLLLRFRQERRKRNHEMELRKATQAGEESERNRIAGELHNNVAVMLHTARGWFGSINKELPAIKTEDFHGALALLDTAIEEVRTSAHALTPEVLLSQGLPRALEIFARQLEKANGIRIIFYYLGHFRTMDNGMDLLLFRCVQELLHNAVQHSGAENILLQLSCHEEVLSITVEDRGKGMADAQYGYGLNLISRTIKQLGGQFHLESKPGKHTSATIEFTYLQRKLL